MHCIYATLMKDRKWTKILSSRSTSDYASGIAHYEASRYVDLSLRRKTRWICLRRWFIRKLSAKNPKLPTFGILAPEMADRRYSRPGRRFRTLDDYNASSSTPQPYRQPRPLTPGRPIIRTMADLSQSTDPNRRDDDSPGRRFQPDRQPRPLPPERPIIRLIAPPQSTDPNRRDDDSPGGASDLSNSTLIASPMAAQEAELENEQRRQRANDGRMAVRRVIQQQLLNDGQPMSGDGEPPPREAITGQYARQPRLWEQQPQLRNDLAMRARRVEQQDLAKRGLPMNTPPAPGLPMPPQGFANPGLWEEQTQPRNDPAMRTRRVEQQDLADRGLPMHTPSAPGLPMPRQGFTTPRSETFGSEGSA
jgi:hypothetical protein